MPNAGIPSTDQQGNPAAAGNMPQIKMPMMGVAAQPAYTPDYSSMIGSSWEVGAAESAMAEQMAAARAAFQSQLRQNFIDLGYSGDLKEGGLGDFSKYIDKATIQKAIDNKYSAYSTIKQQQEKTDAYNAAMLSSSGLGLGGTTTATAQDTVNQAEQARYEGLRNFLSGGQQGLSGLTSLKAQLGAQVANARMAAAQRLAAQYPATPAVAAQPYAPGYDFTADYYGQLPWDTFTGPYDPKDPWDIPTTGTGPYGPGSWPIPR